MGQSYSLEANVNFSHCNQTAEDLLRKNVTQYFLPRRSRGTLTFPACIELCGDGIERWPTEEIWARLTLWLLPAIVLMANFHFAPVSILNTAFVALHHISDPIDSMWSMLTRLELQRRYLYLAKQISPAWDPSTPEQKSISWPRLGHYFRQHINPDARRVAAIWSAYDEIGCVRPNRLPLMMTMTAQGMTDTKFAFPCETTMAHIRKAAYQLTANRTESQRPTWIAVFGYVGSNFAAFIRTKISRDNNQTSHTIAVVALLSYFVALVLMSSAIGVFRSVPDALHALQSLQRSIYEHGKKCPLKERDLFPLLKYLPPDRYRETSWDCEKCFDFAKKLDSKERNMELVDEWMDIAPWTGINSSYRPCKAINLPARVRNRPPFILFLCSLLLVLSSYFPALVLSFHSGSKGFGCRCVAWTLIFSTWLLSLAIDELVKRLLCSAKLLWRATFVKDAIFSILIAGLILAIQIGVLNSCYCRGNVILHHTAAGINLGPFSDKEWARNWCVWPSATVSGFVLMLVFGYVVHIVEARSGKTGARLKLVTGVLCKGETDRKEDLREIERYEIELTGRESP